MRFTKISSKRLKQFMPSVLSPSLQKCSMAPAELRGVWQMRVNVLTSTFLLAYLDVQDYSNGI